MVLLTDLRRVLGHTLIVCVVLRIYLASCNISRNNRVVNPSIPFRSLTPGVCNLESLRLLKNPSNLAFVSYSPRSWKHSYENNKYVSYHNVEEAIKEGNYSSVRYEGLEPLHMKRPSTESQVAQVVKSDRNASLFSGDFLGSRLRSLRDSFNKLTQKDFVWVSNKAGLFGLWYLGSVFYNMENRKLLNLFPLPLTVSTLQNLLTVPLTAFRWLLNLEKPPQFYVPDFPLEKVDLRRDGFFSAVKKSFKNGLNRAEAYVKAYRVVVMQAAYASFVKMVSYVFRNMAFPPGTGFLRAMEPMLVALVSYLVEDTKMPNMAYLSLVPLALGVAYASQPNFKLSSVTLTDVVRGVKTLPFFALVCSVLFSSFRRAELDEYLKQNMDKVGKNLTRSNLNTLTNLLGTLFMLPLVLVDKENWGYSYSNLVKNDGSLYEFAKHLLLSSLAYGVVSQVLQLGFSDMTPMTQAVVQSLKNVSTLLSNTFNLDRKFSKKELYGTALAIASTLLYSLTKDK